MNTQNSDIQTLSRVIRFGEKSINRIIDSKEVGKHYLVWSCLNHCIQCLKSCVLLIRSDYVGSANALLRQIYEFLVWAKAGIDFPAERTKEISEKFFANAEDTDPFQKQEDYIFTDLIKEIKFANIDEVDKNAITIDDAKKEYRLYSALTHASGYAQICCTTSNNEYNEFMTTWSQNRLCLLTVMFLLVLDQYIEKIKERVSMLLSTGTSINVDRSDIEDLVLCQHALDVQKRIENYISELKNMYGTNIEENFLWLCFTDEWTSKKKGGNTNGQAKI